MEAEDASPPASPQTDRFILWFGALLLVATGFFMYSSLREEQFRLAGLEQLEASRQADLEDIERTLTKGTQILNRFNGDAEFVRDQARERLGVAAPDEVVIRLEPGATSTPGRPAAPFFTFPAPAEAR